MATKTKTSADTCTAMPDFADLAKIIQQFKIPGIDVNAVVESQRKDIEALTEANRQAYEGIQALATRRNEILQESLRQWQNTMTGGLSADMLAKQSQSAQQGIQGALEKVRELAEIEAASRGRAWKVLQDRFQESIGNLQNMLQPK